MAQQNSDADLSDSPPTKTGRTSTPSQGQRGNKALSDPEGVRQRVDKLVEERREHLAEKDKQKEKTKKAADKVLKEEGQDLLPEKEKPVLEIVKAHDIGKNDSSGETKELEKTYPDQLSLFRTYLPDDDDKDDYSNTIELYDAIPKYFASKKEMAKLRQGGKFLDRIGIFIFRLPEVPVVAGGGR